MVYIRKSRPLFILMNKQLKFPQGFLWGAATSAHQVEGNNFNDWTEWENKNAKRLAKEAEEYYQDWQKKQFPEMLDPKNYISGRACDHYNRFESDFDIAKSLNHNAHRFSIEWSRIEPEENKFNQDEIEHYKQVIKSLRQRGLEPFVTLWHWTLPVWVAEQGGWENKESIEYFSRYTKKIVKELGTEVNFWITLNEPMVHVVNGYLRGVFPPNKKNVFKTEKVFNNFIKAHQVAYQAIHSYYPKAQVSIAGLLNYFEPAHSWCPIERFIAWLGKYYWNYRFLKKSKDYLDYIGFDYYFHDRIVWHPPFRKNLNQEVSDLNWEIYPKGIYHVLKDLKKYNKPIYIAENGLADAEDTKREKFIKDHLFWMHKAIQEGVDVRGYFYWSLLDNFEWDKDFWPRFGLEEIDYKTMERKIRPSAYEYAKICKENKL